MYKGRKYTQNSSPTDLPISELMFAVVAKNNVHNLGNKPFFSAFF